VTKQVVLKEMRITVVRSYYRESSISGKNFTVDMQIASLKAAGANVDVVARRTDELSRRRLYGAESWIRVATGRDLEAISSLLVRAQVIFFLFTIYFQISGSTVLLADKD